MAKKQAKEILQELIGMFSDPEKIDQLEDTVKLTHIDMIEKPSNNWSWSNKFLMVLQGTNDARGFRQWQKVGRNPLDWQKQISILAPLVCKTKDKNDEDKTFIKGFRAIGLYAVENTYGKSLDEQTKKYELPPLVEVAEKWNCSIRFEKISGQYGHYSQSKQEIVLGSENHAIFFHELAHLGHKLIDGELKGGQDPEQEAIAQLSSAVLSRIYGFKVDNMTYKYIGMYAENHKPESVARLCLRVAEKTSKVLALILGTQKEIEQEKQIIPRERALVVVK